MLNEKQLKEIKEHMSKAQNPIFFFDNDPDGLCSFLLLRRFLNRGRGIAVKSFPDLNASYFRKVDEFKADYIFILDKPVVADDFFTEVSQRNIPVVWIDHHEIQNKIPDFVNYYNPAINPEKTFEPVTDICYELTKRKEDLWIAVSGCISDRYVPSYYNEFLKTYPELSIKSQNAFDIFYNSQIGKIAKILSFALKDRITNVINMIRFLLTVTSPYEILEETSKNHSMHYRYEHINSRYQKLIKKAEEVIRNSRKVLFFQYGGDLSISSDLSNELSYRHPEKIVVVVYITGAKANISVRGKNVRELILKCIVGLENASGGGHKDAVGAQLKVEDLETFRERLEKNIYAH